MTDHDERIAELEDLIHKDDPRFAAGLGAGRPRRPREYRRRGVLALGACGIVLALLGSAAGWGIVLATGLVALGASAHLWAIGPRHHRPASRRPRGPRR